MMKRFKNLSGRTDKKWEKCWFQPIKVEIRTQPGFIALSSTIKKMYEMAYIQ